jgi:putative GTP pyrophosphokinase
VEAGRRPPTSWGAGPGSRLQVSYPSRRCLSCRKALALDATSADPRKCVIVWIVHTKGEVNRAGEAVRNAMSGKLMSPDELDSALRILWWFRAVHSYPLGKANMGLRSVLRTEGLPPLVSQRLKRHNTVMDKLTREPSMQLARMQDIGGCRAVLDSIHDLRAVQNRIGRNMRDRLKRTVDYIERPRTSGYRGVHLIVTYQDRVGEERAVEVQLRTRVMHDWAIAVETMGSRLDLVLPRRIGARVVYVAFSGSAA